MIWADISVSTQANQLSDFGKVCFTWAFPHLDDHGRIKADPMVFKAVVVPMSDHTTEDVARELDCMEEIGLIERWEVDGVKVAFFPGFYQRQPGLNKHTKSKLPDKPGENTPEHTKTHPELNRREGKGTEQKGTKAIAVTPVPAIAPLDELYPDWKQFEQSLDKCRRVMLPKGKEQVLFLAWSAACPNVNAKSCVAACEAWAEAGNVKRSPQGWAKTLTTWIRKEQDKYRPSNGHKPASSAERSLDNAKKWAQR